MPRPDSIGHRFGLEVVGRPRGTHLEVQRVSTSIRRRLPALAAVMAVLGLVLPAGSPSRRPRARRHRTCAT